MRKSPPPELRLPRSPAESPHIRSDTGRRRQLARTALLDRSIEALPIFRLSDSAEGGSLSFTTPSGGRWRVIAYPGDRLPGTFDQDVFIEVMRRYTDAGSPADGVIGFTLHSFLRSLGRRVDGRTYEQLRSSLSRLQHTVLESSAAYFDASSSDFINSSFTLLSSVTIHRRRAVDIDQTSLFPMVASSEPGVARLVLAAPLRRNILAGHSVTVEIATYLSLQSAVARRLYRLLELATVTETEPVWRVPVSELARMLPLAQRYPSHLLRVLQPAHGMLIAAGVLAAATTYQQDDKWGVEYRLRSLAARSAAPAAASDLA